MKVSKLENLLLADLPLFQEQHISLVVEKGSVHAPSMGDDNIYLVDLSDGVAWMLGFFIEGSSTMESLQSRSLLDALQDSSITSLCILSARVCLYRCDNRLCPILYINHCRPIHHGHTIPMSRSIEDIRNKPRIIHWVTRFEKGTKENFLAKSIQDEFCDIFFERVEPTLDHLTNAFTTARTSQAGTPIPSPMVQRSSNQWSSTTSLGSNFPPTMIWEYIQQLVTHTFDNAESNSFNLDGHIPIQHNVWKPTALQDESLLDGKQQQPSVDTMEDKQQIHDKDWYALFLDVTGETTEYGRRKKLKMAKMERMMAESNLALE